MVVKLRNLLGLLFGEMVTNRLIIPGDCCIGGVRHILSSFSELGVISSPTRILSRLPSSTPFPNHLPHGNLHNKHVLFSIFWEWCDPTNITGSEFLSKDTLTCKCAPWSHFGPQHTPQATLRRAPCYRDPSALWWAFPGSGTERERSTQTRHLIHNHKTLAQNNNGQFWFITTKSHFYSLGFDCYRKRNSQMIIQAFHQFTKLIWKIKQWQIVK